MNKTILATAMIVISGIVVYFLKTHVERTEAISSNRMNKQLEMSADAVDRSVGEKANSLTSRASSKASSASTNPDQEIMLSTDSTAELYEALALAVSNREKAEEAMRVIEMKLTALESQLDDIETRGDDPADVQDETLDTFQAIFAEYQDTIIVYEEAASKEESIEARISKAGL